MRARIRGRRVALFLLLMRLVGLATEFVGPGGSPAYAADPMSMLSTPAERPGSWVMSLVRGAGANGARLAPGALLTVTPAMAARLRTQLAEAEAILAEAKLRQDQAQNGLGGLGVRAEDIVMAEAQAASAQATFLTIVNPLQETVQSARTGLEAAEANVRVAEGQRRACGDLSLIGQEVFDGKSGDRRTVTDTDCSDNTKETLNWGVEKARLQRDIAFQQLKLLTDPAMPEILYVIAPSQQAAVAAAANVQKLKTGGGKDRAALDLALTVTQANLDRWVAIAENDPAKLLQAVIGGAAAVHAQALARQQQAQAGQGGPTVRAEDLAIAEASMNARGAEFQQLLTPPQEIVQSARIAVQVNAAAVDQARFLKRACGDLRLSTTFQEGEDKDGDAKKGALKLKTDIECPDDLKDSLRAREEGLEGFKLAPAAALSLLTELDSNEKLQVLVAGKKAVVAIATAELQKLKTGGIFDETALQLNVDVTGAAAQCWQAFAVEASQGGLPEQLRPYAWQDRNPCFLGQLPGKLPPFMKQQVLAPTPAP